MAHWQPDEKVRRNNVVLALILGVFALALTVTTLMLMIASASS
ncbi:hypothetical protein [Aestuariirhabdus haliotis]|nr:hypothetical protein [Aestuariirhabdus haliotis]